MKFLAQILIRSYQLFVPMSARGCCRFAPSCSHYAMEAFAQHNVMRASLLTLRRLLRCNPWGGEGFDPVPERRA